MALASRGEPKLRELTNRPVSSELCQNAALILKHAHDSASALLKAFNLAKAGRGKRGMTTDEEQDLLRAMVVMAAAGLDAMAKQLIRDTLPALVGVEASVKDGLEKFVVRQIRGEAEGVDVLTGGKFLGRILAASSHQTQVIEEYIKELTGGSLQSAEELVRTASALGIQPQGLGADIKILREVFGVRNKIIHELDMNLEGDRRKRNLRKQKDMIRFANVLLQLAENLRDQVDKRLPVATPVLLGDDWLRILRTAT